MAMNMPGSVLQGPWNRAHRPVGTISIRALIVAWHTWHNALYSQRRLICQPQLRALTATQISLAHAGSSLLANATLPGFFCSLHDKANISPLIASAFMLVI